MCEVGGVGFESCVEGPAGEEGECACGTGFNSSNANVNTNTSANSNTDSGLTQRRTAFIAYRQLRLVPSV